jgi:hypothetical protein
MCKKDYTRLWGLSSVQKCTNALWCFAYGAPPWLYAHVEVHILRECLEVMSVSRGSVWAVSLFKRTKCKRYNLDPETKCCESISRDAQEYQLHALGPEELPIFLARVVQGSCRRVHCDTWSCGGLWPLHLPHFHWHDRDSRWYQHGPTLSGFCNTSWGTWFGRKPWEQCTRIQ